MFVSNFLMIFYTDVFGISMAAVSALMLFSRFWDAINDPIVGGLADKTKTRWGRYRPWLLVAAPITAILLGMTFWARPDWPQNVMTRRIAVIGAATNNHGRYRPHLDFVLSVSPPTIGSLIASQNLEKA